MAPLNPFTTSRVSADIEKIRTEEPKSLLPLLLYLNGSLDSQIQMDTLLRSLNFFCYELDARCQPYGPKERLQVLNDYFFNEKAFRISSPRPHEPGDYLIHQLLTSRTGSTLAITALYLHLAQHLELPLFLVHLRDFHLLRWTGGESFFVNLAKRGQLLSETDVVPLLNSLADNKANDRALEIVPAPKILQQFLIALAAAYQRAENPHREKIVYDLWLDLDPFDCTILGRRALLNHQLGFTKEALQDFKRYFSFVDRNQAEAPLQVAFHELLTLESLTKDNCGDLLH